MKQEFTYQTKNEKKTVVMAKHQTEGKYFVDVIPEISVVVTTNWFDTEAEALKRFNSIKKRVENKLINH